MKYYLMPIANHVSAGVSYSGDIPDGAIECSEEIFNDAYKYDISNGVILEKDMSAANWIIYKNNAVAALDKAGITLQRIQRAVVAGRTTWDAEDVIGWCAYMDELNVITSNTVMPAVIPDDLPPMPVYPAGT